MSNIYLNEPPTSGKVLLHTSLGDIDIELWSKEAPLACRNFIQLSLEGYYDGTLFHRIIKDFMCQGGDPSNTGKGGTSSWGRPFKDEIHGRIKFNHRGQLAMANENKPNTNLSQFFITLGDCEWLNRKHTIFGKVTGNTIFNLLRMSDVECGDDDRPVEDIVVKSIEVLWNPFDDIIPRNIKSAAVNDDGPSAQASKKKHRKGKKDLKLLSFGEEAGEEEESIENVPKKMISAHDAVVVDKSGTDGVGGGKILLSAEVDPNLENMTDMTEDTKLRERIPKIDKKSRDVPTAVNGRRISLPGTMRETEHDIGGDDSSKRDDDWRAAAAAMVNSNSSSSSISNSDDNSKELDQIKKDIMRSRRAVKVMTGEEAVKHRDDAALKDFITPLERQRQRFIKRKREHGDREKETLSKLSQFSSNLKTQKKSVDIDNGEGSGHTGTGSSGPKTERGGRSVFTEETYRGQVLEKGEDEEDEEDDTDWHVGKLKFRKHVDDAYRAGQQLQDYTVIDTQRHPSSSSSSYSSSSSSSSSSASRASRGGSGSSYSSSRR